MKISIVIPTLNEEENLPVLLIRLKEIEIIDEIIVVDGYSKDRTVDIAKSFGCKILYDNKGKGSALRKGLKAAQGDVIISMDADLSMSPKEIYLMIAGIEAGYDICMGSRFIQGGGTEDMPFYRKLGNKFFVFLVNLLWHMNYSDLCYGYRAFKRSCIDKLDLRSDGFGIETEISIKVAKKRLKALEVPSYEKPRRFGRGKLKAIRDGIEILKVIVSEISRGEIF